MNGTWGPLAYPRDGDDVLRLSAEDETLSTSADLAGREPAAPPLPETGTGRELFAMFWVGADEAEEGGSAMLALAEL